MNKGNLNQSRIHEEEEPSGNQEIKKWTKKIISRRSEIYTDEIKSKKMLTNINEGLTLVGKCKLYSFA